MTASGIPLWDLPTRLCHWLLVLCVPLAWWSAEEGRYDLHQWLGYTILVVVVARIIWGFIGSHHSRFRQFLFGPGRVTAYVRGAWPGPVGHNPLGGWSVVALLALLLLQAISGLFNADDVLFSGPFHYAADTGLRDAMGEVHEIAFNLLLALVGLHILAVCYHQFWRREPVLGAMVTGRAPGRDGEQPPVSPWWALAVVGLLALLLWAAVSAAPQPPVLVF